MRRLSNTFRMAHVPEVPEIPRVFEMQTYGHSYESLGSNPSPNQNATTTRPEFREPGQNPAQPLHKQGVPGPSQPAPSTNVARDSLFRDKSRFGFELISLHEASAIQLQRRECGEEDHTENGSLFKSRQRSATFSTASSRCPQTPGSTYLEFGEAVVREPLEAPAPAFIQRRSRNRTPLSETSTRLPGFDPPMSRRGLHMSRKSLYRGGPYDSWSLLAGGMPNFQRLRSESDHHRSTLPDWYKEHSLAWSDGVPTSSFRGTVPSGTRLPDIPTEKGKSFFLTVMVLTIFFPPVGVLALWGVFDTTISWCTHGELSTLTVDQRGTVKQQLIVELILYPILIIALAVSYTLTG
ncbi:unnamed protein product [Clonostachys rosea]|uniref:Uncharacterized protein n=1 Tax=Bionectria ochroleuca TaxID=29856 RepID=A0ABY6UXG6_BIOOC|nr:unnamed protein product [Clonostachys rosea]